jgi:hypothetical protein
VLAAIDSIAGHTLGRRFAVSVLSEALMNKRSVTG